MNGLLEISSAAVIVVILLGMLKNIKSEYAYLITLAGAMCILLFVMPKIIAVFSGIENLFTVSSSAADSLKIFIKCVLICRVCELTKSFCKDFSASFIASCVDIAEKAAIITVALPLIESLIKIITNFIGA